MTKQGNVVLAKDAEVGKRYLSPAGIPVVVKEVNGRVNLHCEPTDSIIIVDGTLLLYPYSQEKVSKDALACARYYGVRVKSQVPASALKVHTSNSPASVVDPLLFAGGKTRQEIINALAQSGAKTNDALAVYVSKRMWVLKKAGHRVETSQTGTVKVFPR